MDSATRLETMKHLVEAHYTAAINDQNLELVDQQLTSGFIDHGMPPGTPLGPGPTKEWLANLKTAFPDLAVQTDDILAEGDLVAVRATWTGTHRGEFLGLAPTDRRITFTGAVFWRLEGELLAERWAFIDRSELMRRLSEPAEGAV